MEESEFCLGSWARRVKTAVLLFLEGCVCDMEVGVVTCCFRAWQMAYKDRGIKAESFDGFNFS